MGNMENKMHEEGDKSLMEQYFHVEGLMRRYHHMHHHGGGNPHRGQGRVLKLLAMQPGISQRELAYLLDMRPQSLGELLAKLEKAGLVLRAPSEQDKRVMLVTLTEIGTQAVQEAQQNRDKFGDVFDVLDEEEQRALQGILEKLSAELIKRTAGQEADGHEGKGSCGRGHGHGPHGFGHGGVHGFEGHGGGHGDGHGKQHGHMHGQYGCGGHGGHSPHNHGGPNGEFKPHLGPDGRECCPKGRPELNCGECPIYCGYGRKRTAYE